jgi:hypothetical protein
MTRPSAPTLSAFVALVALLAAACSPSAASPIEDPKQILASSIDAAAGAKSVHVAVTVEGRIPTSILGSGLSGLGLGSAAPSSAPDASGSTSGATIDVTGTTIEGDVDIANSRAALTFTVPALFGLEGQAIVVDGDAYVKATILGTKFVKIPLGSGSGSAASPSPTSSPSSMADDLKARLDTLQPAPVKLADEPCGGTDCYHVQLTGDASGALASAAPGMSGAATVDVWVRKNDLKPAQIKVTLGETGSVNVVVTIVFSAWDAGVDISAPPADQVGTGDFPIPSGLLPSGLPIPSGLLPSMAP